MTKTLTLASSKQFLESTAKTLCRRQGSHTSASHLREEAILVLPQNNECHSSSPLVPLSSALLSPQNASPESPAVTLKSGCTLSSEHSCLNFPLILSRSSWSLS